MAHAVERAAPDFTIARITVDFLRPVPIDRLAVRLETLRAGAKVQRLLGTLLHGDAVIAHAVVTLVRATGVDMAAPPAAAILLPPELARPFQFPFFREPLGYHTAMESRLALGHFGRGRVAIWMRQRVYRARQPHRHQLRSHGCAAPAAPRRVGRTRLDLHVRAGRSGSRRHGHCRRARPDRPRAAGTGDRAKTGDALGENPSKPGGDVLDLLPADGVLHRVVVPLELVAGGAERLA